MTGGVASPVMVSDSICQGGTPGIHTGFHTGGWEGRAGPGLGAAAPADVFARVRASIIRSRSGL
ncbi:hypothetical protein [Mycobacterium sp.]|uniref:hypothetical protein n=1 Tax=Mycobacterium sp. TaxID=1785 RepID=UPI003A85D9C7